MKITFDLSSEELKAVITSQIKEQAILFFQDNKESFVKTQFNKNLIDLKQDGFFKRQVSATLNKAIYDKVNREFSDYIRERVDIELDKVLKAMNISKKINDVVDKKVKEKLRELLEKS